MSLAPIDEAAIAGSRDVEKLDKFSWASFVRFLSLAREHRGTFILGSLMTLVASGINLSLPLAAQRLFPQVLKSGDVRALDIAAGTFALLLLIGTGITFVQWVITVRAGNAVVTALRARLFRHLNRMPISYFDQAKTGELTSRLSNDVSQIQQTLTLDIVNMLANMVTLVGGVIIAIYIDWKLTFAVVGVLGLVMLMFVIAGRRLRRLNRLTLDALSESMGTIQEVLSNIRIVKAFARNDHEDKRIARQLNRVLKLSDKSATFEAAMGSIAMVGFLLLIIAVIWFGGRRVLTGDLTPETLLAFFITVTIISGPMSMLASLYTRLQRAIGASDRLFQILDLKEEDKDPDDAVAFPNVAGEVSFRNVTFGYDHTRPVLKNLNLYVPAGKVTALVGQSGAGKTTLSAMLYRFYDPQAGTIEVDDVPIDRIRRDDLREHIGIVPQMPILFNVSIMENIRYGRLNATDDEVIEAARAANVAEFAEALPLKYHTIVGERGVTLSGGQNQRVAIARALLKNPRILILDEATSALDTRSEALVKEALERLMIGRTTLVIAHRLTTIQNADQIAVMANGEVVEKGTHNELMAMNAHYAYLHNLNESN